MLWTPAALQTGHSCGARFAHPSFMPGRGARGQYPAALAPLVTVFVLYRLAPGQRRFCKPLQCLTNGFFFLCYPSNRCKRSHSFTSYSRNGLTGFIGISAQHRQPHAVPGLPVCVLPLFKISVGGSSKRKHFPCSLRCVFRTRLSRCVAHIYRSENSFIIPSFRTVPSA